MSQQEFLVSRENLAQTTLNEVAPIVAGDGQAVLALERFALTANNITYGVAGDAIGYWQFFPADAGMGKIPVWGIGVVTSSNHPDVRVGDRYYGYYPMAHELVIKPEKVNARGLVDGSAHRAELPVVYNQYSLMSEGNGFDPALDNEQMIYRPLFTTSFVLDDFLADNDFFGADTVVLGSASSKTAFGLAYMLNKRKGSPTQVKVVGLTSAGNKGFVSSLGLYDEVVAYDDVESIDASRKTVYVDMAGNRPILARIHHHLQDNLVCSCGVGVTHWESREGEAPASLPGAKPTMFFAPSQIQKRIKEWGPEAYQSKLASATNEFFGDVNKWVKIEEHPFSEVSSVYETVLRGASPNRGYVVVV